MVDVNSEFDAQALVSVCIPTYERHTQLLKALNSCFTQTYQNIEIVIFDNSESDSTLKLIESLAKKNIRYFKNPKNVGPIENLKLAVDHASGRYIKVLMDDDILYSSCIEKMVQALESNPSAGVVMAPMKIINDQDNQINYRAYLIKKLPLLYRYRKRSQIIPRNKIIRDFLTSQYPCCVPSGIMYRKECFEILGSLDLDMKFAVDVEICARFATKYDFFYIDEPLSAWRYSKVSHTVVNLHQKGQDTHIYYELTKKLIANPQIAAMFSVSEYEALKKNAYFFSSKRAVISIIAGIRSGNFELVVQTLNIMRANDPYRSNLFLLPFNLAKEIILAGLSWIK